MRSIAIAHIYIPDFQICMELMAEFTIVMNSLFFRDKVCGYFAIAPIQTAEHVIRRSSHEYNLIL